MSETPIQVARVTKELRALLVQLHWSSFEGFSPSDQKQILDELLNAGLIEDLRTTMDQLSRFLWLYVESAARTTSSSGPDYEMQSKHLGRITEVLRVLHRPASPAEDPLAFVERLTQSVDRHLETAGQSAVRSTVSLPAQVSEPEQQEQSPESSNREDAVVSSRRHRSFERGRASGARLGPISWR
jgi:hypothetical protein